MWYYKNCKNKSMFYYSKSFHNFLMRETTLIKLLKQLEFKQDKNKINNLKI